MKIKRVGQQFPIEIKCFECGSLLELCKDDIIVNPVKYNSDYSFVCPVCNQTMDLDTFHISGLEDIIYYLERCQRYKKEYFNET